MILDFLNIKTPVYLDCRFNLADVLNVAKKHILAIERGRFGEHHILNNENLALTELLRLIAKITGLAMPKIRIPYWIALAARTLSKFLVDCIPRHQPGTSLTCVRLAHYQMFFNSDKAVNELGFPKNTLPQALAGEIEWFVSERLVNRRLPLQQQILGS